MSVIKKQEITINDMKGYLERRGITLYFINEFNSEFMVNTIVKIDKMESLETSRYLLNIGVKTFIKTNMERNLNKQSVIAINGYGKLKKGTGITKVLDVWN
jgi:hypothetical protein